MSSARRPGSVPILRIGSTLLASIQFEIEDTIIDAFQDDVLQTIERTSATGLVIDISALDNVDSYVARKLADTGKMTKLMGANAVIVGMRPEVSATLVRMGFSFQGIHTALSLEEGLDLLKGLRRKKPGGR